MSAYTRLHPDHFNSDRKNLSQKNLRKLKAAFGYKYCPHIVDQSSQLSLAGTQQKFLNSAACQRINPFRPNFWLDLKSWLAPISRQAASYPKAPSYRRRLEPYLLQRVTITAGSWWIYHNNKSNGRLFLALKNVRLTHAYDNKKKVWAFPNITINHMNVEVSSLWYRAILACGTPYGAPLTVTGMLYEYTSSKNTRNIGILPILLEPKVLPLTARQNRCVKRPDSLYPGASM